MQICTVQRENLAAYNSKKEKKSYVRELKFGMLCLVYKCVCVCINPIQSSQTQ